MLDMEAIRANIDHDRALLIKQKMQHDEDCTWRALTWECWRVWGEPDWIEPGNQFWGKALLEVAGEVLGENPFAW
jgi:hypothetical protein